MKNAQIVLGFYLLLRTLLVFLAHLPSCTSCNFFFTITERFVILHEMKAKVALLFPTLCDLMDYRVHGILQARILEWVAFPFSRGSSQPRNQTGISCIAGRFFTNWAIREAPFPIQIMLFNVFLDMLAPLRYSHPSWPYSPESCALLKMMLRGFMVMLQSGKTLSLPPPMGTLKLQLHTEQLLTR